MLYSQLGYYIAGRVSQLILKEATAEKILREAPDSLLLAVPLAGNEKLIHWEEEGKEFSLLGKMYDIVRTRVVNGRKIFYCSSDEQEDRLLEQMNKITGANHHHTEKNNTIPGVKLVYNTITIQKLDFLLLYIPGNHAGIHYDVALPRQAAAITVPPPRA